MFMNTTTTDTDALISKCEEFICDYFGPYTGLEERVIKIDTDTNTIHYSTGSIYTFSINYKTYKFCLYSGKDTILNECSFEEIVDKVCIVFN